jgi:uncharacterized lipoprotein YddW (UPF0748 family)
MSIRSLAVAALALLSLSALSRQFPNEPRVAWVYIGRGSKLSTDPTQGRREVAALIDKLARAHINMVFPWVRSDYATALEDPSYGSVEPLARWDSLGEVVKDARAHGMVVHLWYAFSEDKGPHAPEYDPSHGGNRAWAAVRYNEIVPGPDGKVKPKWMQDVCPNRPEVRQFEIKMINHLLDRYPQISGVHIEEPGYTASGGECACDVCQRLFEQTYHMDLLSNFRSKQAVDLRCRGTTLMMQELRQNLKQRNPSLLLSCNGGYSATGDRLYGRDWANWARMGLLDFFVAQLYSTTTPRFGVMVKRVVNDLAPLPVLAGIATDWSHSGGGADYNTAPIIVQEVEIARELGARGIGVFYAQGLKEDMVQALAQGPFSRLAPLASPDSSGGSPPVAETPNIAVLVDGQPVAFAGTGPMMMNNRVLVPLRGVFERLGATVQWRDSDSSVTAKRGSTTVRLRIGSRSASVNGSTVRMDVPATVINGRTLVPIRFISEALGARVNWDAANTRVLIYTR